MGYVGIEEDYYVSVKSVLDITAETGALITQSRIRELTPADVAPVRHGRWTRFLYRNEKGGCVGAEMFCSECGLGNGRDAKMHYCPNCGAKMDR